MDGEGEGEGGMSCMMGGVDLNFGDGWARLVWGLGGGSAAGESMDR